MGDLSGSGFAFGYAGGVLSLLDHAGALRRTAGGKTLLGLDPAFGLDAGAREGTRFVGPVHRALVRGLHGPLFPVGARHRPAAAGARASAMRSGFWIRTIKGLAPPPEPRHLSRRVDVLPRRAQRPLRVRRHLCDPRAQLVDHLRGHLRDRRRDLGGAVFVGSAARRTNAFGPKPVIIAAIWGLIAVCVTVVSMDRSQIFGVPLPEGSTCRISSFSAAAC